MQRIAQSRSAAPQRGERSMTSSKGRERRQDYEIGLSLLGKDNKAPEALQMFDTLCAAALMAAFPKLHRRRDGLGRKSLSPIDQ